MAKKSIVLGGILAAALVLALFTYKLAFSPSVSDGTSYFQSIKPVAEFAPTDTVVLSEHLFADNLAGVNLAKEIISAGSQVLVMSNDAYSPDQTRSWLSSLGFSPEEQHSMQVINISHNTHWIRDFGPISVQVQRGTIKSKPTFLDFRYYSHAPLDDTVPYQLGLYLNASVEHLPFGFDGGNFLTNGRDCYMTDFFETSTSSEAAATKSKDLSTKNIQDYFTQYSGCNHVTVLTDTPHIHIDMFAKILSPSTVLVGEVLPETKALVGKVFPQKLEDLNHFAKQLDQAAKTMGESLKVIRIPMPIPQEKFIRTYTNSLLVNNTAIIPRFTQFGYDGDIKDEANLATLYEDKVKSAYESLGFKAVFIDSGDLIASGGGFHCAALQLPRVDAPLAQR